jgi:hypothetical protein
MEEMYNSRLELQMLSLEFIISFSKLTFIWDLGVRFGSFILGSCNTNLVQDDEFLGYIF